MGTISAEELEQAKREDKASGEIIYRTRLVRQLAEEAADPDLAEKSAEIQTSDESDPDFSAEHQMSADWSGVRIPVLEPLTGGTQCEPRELVYDRGDGVVRMIPDPLGILSDEGLSPFFPEMKNPSANVSGQGNS